MRAPPGAPRDAAPPALLGVRRVREPGEQERARHAVGGRRLLGSPVPFYPGRGDADGVGARARVRTVAPGKGLCWSEFRITAPNSAHFGGQ